jgi:thiamine pyrophosphate-dependent acetolactate synthase large subunit-like protein
MAPTALWTAAHHQIPLLTVVANNRSYFNDELHQERVARTRERPVENRWIGQRIDEPAVNFAGLAKDLGVEGFGPISTTEELDKAMTAAAGLLAKGEPVLVDVLIAKRS